MKSELMKVLIFKTDIKTKKEVKAVKPVFRNYSSITNWSVDTADIDNVLRIEATENVCENDIMKIVKTCGFNCEVLTN